MLDEDIKKLPLYYLDEDSKVRANLPEHVKYHVLGLDETTGVVKAIYDSKTFKFVAGFVTVVRNAR